VADLLVEEGAECKPTKGRHHNAYRGTKERLFKGLAAILLEIQRCTERIAANQDFDFLAGGCFADTTLIPMNDLFALEFMADISLLCLAFGVGLDPRQKTPLVLY
jgi:hypothetical protein